MLLTDSGKNRIYEGVFSAEGEGQVLRNKRETQNIYGQSIYKAMVFVFESVFADISNDLNLRPVDFDIDKIEVKNNLIEEQQGTGQNIKKRLL